LVVVGQFQASLEDTGLLEITLSSTRPDATLLSLDGNRTVAWITPSGEIGAILVQDYVGDEETRTIPFVFGDIELVNEQDRLSVFLVPALP